MTKLRGRQTTPEAYIRAYRKALANAANGLEEARSSKRLCLTARIRFNTAAPASEGVDQSGEYHRRELLKAGRVPRKVTQYGTTYEVFDFDLSQPADLKLWIEHCHGVGWNNAEISGPGEI
jgi:hypothetical protein